MKKPLLISLVCCGIALANPFYDSNDKSFKDGFYAGIKALEFQRKNDGIQMQRIAINKPYLLVFETKNTAMPEALFLQVIASREGYETHLTKNFVTFGAFEREADAKEIGLQLNEKFKIKTRVLSGTKELISYPFLWDSAFSALLEQAKASGVLIKREYLGNAPKTQVSTQKKTNEVLNNRFFSLKNKQAMGYECLGDETDSKNYHDTHLRNGTRYYFEAIIKTKQGEGFVKAGGKNLYFAIDDVVLNEKATK